MGVGARFTYYFFPCYDELSAGNSIDLSMLKLQINYNYKSNYKFKILK
jgi:hypothetical protein